VPEKQESPVRDHRASRTIRAPHGHPDSSGTAVPNVAATLYPPSGRRSLALLIVSTCPHCTAGHHAHRGSALGGLREAGCRRGTYNLVPRPAITAVRARLAVAR
jgi:hypothetical protein